MKTVPLSGAKEKLSSLLDAVVGHDVEIVITRNGRAAAVLVSPEDFESWKETAAVRANADLVAVGPPQTIYEETWRKVQRPPAREYRPPSTSGEIIGFSPAWIAERRHGPGHPLVAGMLASDLACHAGARASDRQSRRNASACRRRAVTACGLRSAFIDDAFQVSYVVLVDAAPSEGLEQDQALGGHNLDAPAKRNVQKWLLIHSSAPTTAPI